jgi:hypothetical protein
VLRIVAPIFSCSVSDARMKEPASKEERTANDYARRLCSHYNMDSAKINGFCVYGAFRLTSPS